MWATVCFLKFVRIRTIRKLMKTDVRRLSLIPFVHRATHRIGLWLDAAQPALRVTQGEAHLLAHLAEAGTSSVKALHSAFAHKRSSLTSYLDRLEGRGYVLRALHPKDRRSFLVSLTPAGAAAAARIHRRLAALEAAALRRLAPRDIHALRGALQALQDAAEVQKLPKGRPREASR
jgi:DNA-binding MarR family transcriptional regulator